MQLNEFIAAVKTTLQANIPLETEFLVADVGLILKSRNGIDWTEFGFVKLGDLLRFLSEQKFLTISHNAKHALVVTLHKSEVDEMTVLSHLSANARLERQVWHAFTNESVTNQRLLNKATGDVWSLPDRPQDFAFGQWLTIDPISSELQKAWVDQFLSAEDVDKDAEIETALADPSWYTTFPACVNKKRAGAGRRWNAFRSEKVVNHVLLWADQNKIDRELILFHSTPHRKFQSVKRVGRFHVTRTEMSNGGDLRSALLNAIEQMSDEELLAVSIPSRYLVKSLRPELL